MHIVVVAVAFALPCAGCMSRETKTVYLPSAVGVEVTDWEGNPHLYWTDGAGSEVTVRFWTMPDGLKIRYDIVLPAGKVARLLATDWIVHNESGKVLASATAETMGVVYYRPKPDGTPDHRWKRVPVIEEVPGDTVFEPRRFRGPVAHHAQLGPEVDLVFQKIPKIYLTMPAVRIGEQTFPPSRVMMLLTTKEYEIAPQAW